MLRRFNSLIKGPKGQISDEELSELHVSLRPALSVDSSLFSSSPHHHVNPLQQQFARAAREESLSRARRGPGSENNQTSGGQTSLNAAASPQRQHKPGDEFVIARVPEERLWKEGYEHAGEHETNNPLLDSPEKPSSASPAARDSGDNGAAAASASDPEFTFRSVPVTQSEAATRVLRTSSDAVAAAASNRNDAHLATYRSADLHTAVDIPDAQAGSSVDLETVRRSVFTAGPGRTISSWSTDSAAEHCRICQQRMDEPLIDLGCMCRGEMAKSHKSCIEMWFKNKGTNKCEVCQQVASNIPAPSTSPAPHFWVWRLGGPYAATGQQRQSMLSESGARSRVGFQGGPLVNRPVLIMIIRKHPLIPVMWLGMLAFMTYLFVDAINTSTIGYAAMPIGFLFGLLFDVLLSIFLGASALPVDIIIGVLVVLGLGTAVRLVLEYFHEQNMQRRIQLLELDPVNEDPAEGAESTDRHSTTPQNGPSAV